MQVDIKSLSIKALRNTFDQVARFTGNDKSASRYLEATIGIQPEVNFHYQPLWSENRSIYDKANTVIVMNDWYRLLDPVNTIMAHGQSHAAGSRMRLSAIFRSSKNATCSKPCQPMCAKKLSLHLCHCAIWSTRPI